MSRSREALAIGLLMLAAGVVYLPMLGGGAVAEDLQIALKAAKISDEPAELLRPFQGVWRPAAWAAFVPLLPLARADWAWARAVQLALGLAVLGLGFRLLRTAAGLPLSGAAVFAALWVLSPLTSELLLGETLFIGHCLFAVAALASVLAWSSGRMALAAAAAALAAACSEQWVVLPALFLIGDVAMAGRPLSRAFRAAVPWIAGVTAWVVAYGAVTSFGYRSVYRLDVVGVSAKLAGTAGAFFRLVPLAGLVPGGLPHRYLAGAMGGVALLAGLVVWAVVRRRHETLYCLAACLLFLAPTAAALGQTSRWTALPYLFFLAACAPPAMELWRNDRLRGALRWPIAGLAAVLIATDAITVRADSADWREFGQLNLRVAEEAAPLLAAARAGRTLVILRGNDGGPLAQLLGDPRGQPKLYFPRPDDPYGVVSLQAVLTWELQPHGLAVERVRRPPAGVPAVAFLHETGGFKLLPAIPDVAVRHPAQPGPGVPGVVLVPVAWSSFAADAFP